MKGWWGEPARHAMAARGLTISHLPEGPGSYDGDYVMMSRYDGLYDGDVEPILYTRIIDKYDEGFWEGERTWTNDIVGTDHHGDFVVRLIFYDTGNDGEILAIHGRFFDMTRFFDMMALKSEGHLSGVFKDISKKITCTCVDIESFVAYMPRDAFAFSDGEKFHNLWTSVDGCIVYDDSYSMNVKEKEFYSKLSRGL